MKELVDSGGKITDEGWKVLAKIVKEREKQQARGSMTQNESADI